MRRIAVIGGGLIGRRHAAAVAAHPGCALAAVVDPDPAVVPPPGVPRVDVPDAVPSAVDGVIVATPTALHAAHGIDAARRGWHLLVEKPVAADLAGALALADAVEAAGVRALVGHHRRHHPRVRRLRALVRDGAIGTPVTATAIWAMRKPDAYFAGTWRADSGSPVLINLVHDVDVLRFVLGEVEAVTGLPGASLRGAGRTESGAVALRFASGATAAISFADTAPSPWGFEAGTGENPNIGATGQDMLWIAGTEGGVAFPSLTVWRGRDWGEAAHIASGPEAVDGPAPLEAQLDHFLAVMDGAEPVVGIADAARTLDVTLRIEAAMAPLDDGQARRAT